MMKQAIFLQILLGILVCFTVLFANAEDPYRYYTWFVTYGTRAPLGVKQQALRKKLNSGLALPLPDGLLINGLHKASVFTGQKAVLVTLRGAIKDYYIVASTRFTKPILTTTGILRYQGSNTPASLPLPIAPTYHVHWSIKQARTFSGKWTTESKKRYNLADAISRHTVQLASFMIRARPPSLSVTRV
ncbi:hypothetical protein V6N13_052575 [Hibiscus sabdariffa]